MSKKTRIIRFLAQHKALDSVVAEKIMNTEMEDGGAGSGNFGHAGRPGKKGGSAPNKGGGGGGSAPSGSSPSMKEYVGRLASEAQKSGPMKEYVGRLASEAQKSGKASASTPKKARRPGSGNWGHTGTEGRGGSAPSSAGGLASGNAGVAKNGTVYSGKDYSLAGRKMRSIRRVRRPDGSMGWSGPGRKWEAKGKTSKELPKGSGTTRISEQDVGMGVHTIVRHLNADGTLTPERQALHEQIVQGMFKGKKPKGPGEQKTFYFLGGGSASGKGSFTRESTSKKYGMPSKKEVTVVDADELKKALPEYNPDAETGTTDRKKAANFAHEESSALAKRAIEAAFANGHDVTLDGTGDSGAKKVIGKIEQARAAGYRVEGRYCTASIETALQRNEERAIKEQRLVDRDSVIRIHKDVSAIFEEVAPHFDHVELWDHDGPEGSEPRLVATCERGQPVKIVDQELWKKFKAKAHWGE